MLVAGAVLVILLSSCGLPGLTCPSISRSKAIHIAVGGLKGLTPSAKLMTLAEYEAGNPSSGHRTSPGPQTLIWVVAYSGHLPNWSSGPPGALHPPMTWYAVTIDATKGDLLSREGGSVGSWPDWYNKLPDRASFCTS
jgi:hypothetical protein